MDRIDVTPSQLRAAADQLDAQAELLVENLTELAQAGDTLRLQWEGDAQEAFDDKQTLFRAQMTHREQALRTVAEALRDAGDGYGQLDRDCARALGGE
jgi:WXG100 family type VII secretion target